VDARGKTLTGDQEFKRQLLQSAISFSQKTGGTSNGLIRASSGAIDQSHADINQLKEMIIAARLGGFIPG
jgi:hypothetical protein